MELAHRVLEGPKPPEAAINLCQWAGQEVIGEEDSRILLRPPCSAAAFTLHMSTLVDPTPAHSLPCLNMELEFQRQKPPDRRGEGWLAYNAISEKVQTSVIKHSPSHGTVLMPPNIPSTCQGWAETHCLLNVELAWHTHSKPPDTLGEIRQRSADVISANTCTRATCSPMYQAVLTLPIFLLVSSAQVTSPCRRNNELVSRVRKPPDVTEHWPLDVTVNKAEKGGRRGHSPIIKPMPAPFACSPILSMRPALTTSACWGPSCHATFAALVGGCFRKAFIIQHTNGKGCF
jgi:hypothetical protein